VSLFNGNDALETNPSSAATAPFAVETRTSNLVLCGKNHIAKAD